MPDYTITASQVIPVTGYTGETHPAAVAITAGDSCYLNTSSQWALAQCDGTLGEAAVAGIALNDAEPGQPVQVITSGDVDMGAGAAIPAGMLLVVPRTAGGVAPSADLIAADRVSVIGYGIGTNKIRIAKMVTGQVKP